MSDEYEAGDVVRSRVDHPHPSTIQKGDVGEVVMQVGSMVCVNFKSRGINSNVPMNSIERATSDP